MLAWKGGRPGGFGREGGVTGGLMGWGPRVLRAEARAPKGKCGSLGGPRLLMRVEVGGEGMKVVSRVAGVDTAVTFTCPPNSSTMP